MLESGAVAPVALVLAERRRVTYPEWVSGYLAGRLGWANLGGCLFCKVLARLALARIGGYMYNDPACYMYMY